MPIIPPPFTFFAIIANLQPEKLWVTQQYD